MTLIIGTTFGVFGDRKISSSIGTKCDPIRKICANDILVAGWAGDYYKILKAVEAVESGESDPKILAKIGADGILVRNGRMIIIDAGHVKTRPKRDKFYCTGSGWQEGMAHLSGQIAAGKKVTDKTVKATMRYVARVRDDCGCGVDFIG
jgi:hypothetical protein